MDNPCKYCNKSKYAIIGNEHSCVMPCVKYIEFYNAIKDNNARIVKEILKTQNTQQEAAE